MISVDLKVSYNRTYSYALTGTPRRIVRSITVTNTGPEQTAGTPVSVEVSIEAPLDPQVIATWKGPERELPRPGGEIAEAVHWTGVNARISPVLLGRLSERVQAEIVVRVLAGDSTVTEQRLPLVLLAAADWVHDEANLDLLAAFVLPNSAALRPIMTKARELLAERTDSSGTDGYQGIDRGTPDRVHDIAEAVYDAIRAEQLHYSNPPGAFEGHAQKVRSPQTIMGERAATCLDTTVLYAACLAQAGLNPVLCLVKGHAFAGYFTGNGALPVAALTEKQKVADLFANGQVRPVETTTMCEQGSSFTAAQSQVAEFFTARLNEFDALVDVRVAWRSGITPPTQSDADLLTEHDADAAKVDLRTPAAQAFAGGVNDAALEVDDTDERAVPPRVRQWLSTLLDLSSRNNLLSMNLGTGNRPSARFMEFVLPPDVLGKIDDDLFTPRNRLVINTPGVLPAKYKRDGITDTQGADELRSLPSPLMYPPYTAFNELSRDVDINIKLRDSETKSPADGLTDLEIETRVMAMAEDAWSASLTKRMSKLQSLSKEAMLATGSNSLYLALGTLMWTEEAGFRGSARPVTWNAPLYLYPVIIEGGRGGAYTVRLDPSSSITPNYCLREKLRREPYNLDLPELENPTADDLGINLNLMLASIRAKLTAARMDHFTVQSRCVLGVFEYSSFRLWRDLHDHWAEFCEASPVVRHLVYTPNDAFSGTDTGDEPGLEPYTPIDADDSQVQAVQWALNGRSFRLEGPPGTGKTQTITNLIASCMAHGKTVLFVAEKQTALQQVKKRLYDVGLGDFSLELHAKGDSDARLRKTITEQVQQALEAAPVIDDRAWENQLFQVQRFRSSLDQYRDALHEPNPAGLTYWECREQLVRLADKQAIEVSDEFVADFDSRWPVLRDVVLDLHSALDLLDDPATSPWRFVAGALLPVEWQELGNAVRAMRPALQAIRGQAGVLNTLGEIRDPAVFTLVVNGLGLAAGGVHPQGMALDLDGDALPTWRADLEQLTGNVGTLTGDLARHRAVVGGGFLRRDDLDEVATAAEAAGDANFISRGRRLNDLHRILGDDALSTDRSSTYESVASLLDARSRVDSVIARAGELGVALPRDWSPVDESANDDFSDIVSRTVEYVASVTNTPGAQVIARQIAGSENPGDTSAVEMAAEVWSRFASQLTWSPDSIERWLGGRSLLQAWESDLDRWEADANLDRFIDLQRWIGLADAADRLAQIGLAEVADSIVAGTETIDDLLERVQRGVYEAVLEERARVGNIDRFDAGRHEQRITAYDEGFAELRKMMTQRLAALARQPRNGADEGRSRAAAQDLLRELKPARGDKTPVRTLLAKHGSELAEMMPCFLMSPDSVASLLPVGSVAFDVVVFDEASQVRTANAVGALGRGKAAIVVGDSKQMPPTAGFSANSGRFVDDADDWTDTEPIEGAEDIDGGEGAAVLLPVGQAARDVESILQEFDASRLPHMQLVCHYRSQDELLIAFSNAEIYDTPMLTFPSRAGAASKALSFVRVDGQFIRRQRQWLEIQPDRRISVTRTNMQEAEAVVAEVLHRLRDPERRQRRLALRQTGAESIIVVTFNKPQMELITALLENTPDPVDRKLVEAAFEEDKDDETGVQVADAQLKIRNLESVQGDEAETVIFSVAFSKLAPGESRNPSNKVPLNFGPVTAEGGFRRLNVAVTRARREMVVFCSFDPSDMDIKDTTSEGARLLQKFLQLAKDGPRHSGSVGIAVQRSDHLEQVAEAIADLGYSTTTQLGLSKLRVDIAVSRPGVEEWDVAVMLDGPQWADMGTAYQRELLAPKVLSGLGWEKVLRVWLPSWIHDRERTLAGLKTAIDEALSTPRVEVEPPQDEPPSSSVPPDVPVASGEPTQTHDSGVASEAAGGDSTRGDTEIAESGHGDEQLVGDNVSRTDGALDPRDGGVLMPAAVVDAPRSDLQRSEFVAFEPIAVEHARDLRRFGDPGVDVAIGSIITSVLITEAPIEITRLTRLVGRCIGFDRVSKGASASLRALIPSELIVDDPVGTTVWASPAQHADWYGFRPSQAALRTVDEIPFVELTEAVRHLRSTGISSDDDLLRPLANLFGFSRLGSQVKARLGHAIELTPMADPTSS